MKYLAGRAQGVIRWIKRDIGMILADAGVGILFHSTELIGTDWPSEICGTRVTYATGITKRGKPRALAVRKQS